MAGFSIGRRLPPGASSAKLRVSTAARGRRPRLGSHSPRPGAADTPESFCSKPIVNRRRYPPRRSTRPADAGQSDPGRLGHVRLCPGDGRAGRSRPAGRHPAQDDHPGAPRAATRRREPSKRPAGMLNSIGLDNDGIEAFIERQLPYLAGLGTAIIVSIAGARAEEFVAMAARLDGVPGVAALELNISCPNVTRRRRFRHRSADCARRWSAAFARRAALPMLAKLTPNVTDIVADRPGGRGRRGRRRLADQHVPGHGRRLAAPAAAAGQRAGRTERPGDQADRPAGRLPGRPGGRRPAGRHRRHRHRSTT